MRSGESVRIGFKLGFCLNLFLLSNTMFAAEKNLGSCAAAVANYFYAQSDIPRELTILSVDPGRCGKGHYRLLFRYSGEEGIPQAADIFVDPKTCRILSAVTNQSSPDPRDCLKPYLDPFKP